MDKECDEIRQEALQLSWYMRGGISYEQALQLSVGERKIVTKIIMNITLPCALITGFANFKMDTSMLFIILIGFLIFIMQICKINLIESRYNWV